MDPGASSQDPNIDIVPEGRLFSKRLVYTYRYLIEVLRWGDHVRRSGGDHRQRLHEATSIATVLETSP